eukprot:scaffold636_cov252-Pinguiococcus_pyrenoidosus.AAC.12
MSSVPSEVKPGNAREMKMKPAFMLGPKQRPAYQRASHCPAMAAGSCPMVEEQLLRIFIGCRC